MSVRRIKRRNKVTGKTTERWYVDVDIELPDGTRCRERKVSPVQTRRGAEAYEIQLRASLISGTFKRKEAIVPTLSEFAKIFMNVHAEVHNKPSEIQGKQSALRLHLLPAFGGVRLDQLDEFKIASFIGRQRELGLTNKSINNHLIVLRTMLGKAVDWGNLTRVPKIKKLPVVMTEARFLDFDEADRLVAAGVAEGSQWHSAVVVALNTGLRLGELLGLQWDDCDLRARRLTVKRSNWQGRIGTPKSGRERVIPLNEHALAELKSLRHLKGPWVWCRDDGSHCNKDDFKNGLRRIRCKAGLPHFAWHTLRHTFASHLVMQGVSLKAVQELLGHGSITVTMRYAHLMPQVGQRAVDVLVTRPVESRQPDGNTIAVVVN